MKQNFQSSDLAWIRMRLKIKSPMCLLSPFNQYPKRIPLNVMPGNPTKEISNWASLHKVTIDLKQVSGVCVPLLSDSESQSSPFIRAVNLQTALMQCQSTVTHPSSVLLKQYAAFNTTHIVHSNYLLFHPKYVSNCLDLGNSLSLPLSLNKEALKHRIHFKNQLMIHYSYANLVPISRRFKVLLPK